MLGYNCLIASTMQLKWMDYLLSKGVRIIYRVKSCEGAVAKVWQRRDQCWIWQENNYMSLSFLFFLLLLAIDKQGKLEMFIRSSWQIQDIGKGEASLVFDKK